MVKKMSCNVKLDVTIDILVYSYIYIYIHAFFILEGISLYDPRPQ